jgi:hypothetical protein
MTRLQCPLGRLIPNRPNVEKMKGEAWMEHGLALFDIDDPELLPIERSTLEGIANRMYGKRKVTLDGKR